MIDQLPIFDTSAPVAETAPRCRLCARPARWNPVLSQWGMYCYGNNCNNRERICQSCESPFVMNVDGAGTKYCSADCKADGYRPYKVGTTTVSCAWCGRATESSRKPRTNGWPFICNDCLTPIAHVLQRLRSHHVPHERVRRLLDDPGCDICGRDILTPVHDSRMARDSALLVVDHDHRCCPRGHYSCGKCVRGLLCSQCNAAAGMLRDDPALARSLADYLVRYQ